jgi:hypothetical protein
LATSERASIRLLSFTTKVCKPLISKGIFCITKVVINGCARSGSDIRFAVNLPRGKTGAFLQKQGASSKKVLNA